MGLGRVSDKETIIDNRLRCGYSCSNSLDRGTHSGCDPKCGASAVLPRGLAIRAGAASGIRSFGITAEARGAVAGLGQERAGNARLIPRPRKHGLELSRDGSACRADHQQAATFVDGTRQMVGMRLSALRLPLLLPGGRFARGGRHSSDAQASRERSLTSSLPGLTRQSMRGGGLRGLAAYRSFAANQHGPPGQARW
jgi:hypothetical protein